MYRLAFNAGWAFGPATAGFLATHSFTWLFIGDAATSLLFGLLAWFALPRGSRTGAGEPDHSPATLGTLAALKCALSDRKLRQVLAASFVVALGFFQMNSSFGLQVTARGFSASTYGVLISLNGLLVVLFELPLTRFTQRFASRRVMALGYLLIGFGFSLNAFASTIFAFAMAMAVFTLGEIISMPVSTAYIADLAPAHLRGRYMGAFGFTWSLALMFGPSAGMALFGANPAALWVGCGILGLLAAAIILRE
jgi:MFS family permease